MQFCPICGNKVLEVNPMDALSETDSGILGMEKAEEKAAQASRIPVENAQLKQSQENTERLSEDANGEEERSTIMASVNIGGIVSLPSRPKFLKDKSKLYITLAVIVSILILLAIAFITYSVIKKTVLVDDNGKTLQTDSLDEGGNSGEVDYAENNVLDSADKIEYDELNVYKDKYVAINLKYLSHKGIAFTIENLTDETIYVDSEGIALDGQSCDEKNMIGDAILPNSIKDSFLECDLKTVKHEQISGTFLLQDKNEEEIKTLHFSNIKIGDEKNLEWKPASKDDLLYSDNYLDCSFLQIEGDQLKLEIKNKSKKQFEAFVDSAAIDKRDVGELSLGAGENACPVLPNTTAILNVEVPKLPSNFKQISGLIYVTFEDDDSTSFQFKLEK